MPIDCANPPCERVLPASTVISVFGDDSIQANADCSTNLLYLVDDPGLVNQSDTGSGAYLSKNNRIRQISSIDEVELHFSPCSRVHFELSRFFSWPVGTLKRPRAITVAYFDRSAETPLEAVQAIYECYTCFYTMTHVAYDSDGNALFDTNMQMGLAEWGTAYRVRTVLPTVDANLVNTAETSSQAYMAKKDGYHEAVFQLLNEACVDVLDADCNPTGATTNTYGVQHLVMAGVIASISSESDDYSFTVMYKPGGLLTGVSTASLTQSELYAAMGSNPYAGGVQKLASHHVNVYHNIAGKRILLEGLTATGQYIDDRVHQRYIRDRLDADLMELMTGRQAISMTDLSDLTTTITRTIREFINQKLISDAPGSINPTDFENVFLSGNGWVFMKNQTKQSNLNNRVTPTFKLCYVRPGGVHYISIGLCETVLGGSI